MNINFKKDNFMKIKKIIYIFVFSAYASTLFVPVFAIAQNSTNINGPFSIVQCTGVVDYQKDSKGNLIADGKGGYLKVPNQRKCDFQALMQNFRAIVNWFFSICVLLSVIYFAWGGILYMSGEPKKISDAHQIFKSVLIGFGVFLTAWIGVYTIVSLIVDQSTKAGGSATDLLDKK